MAEEKPLSDSSFFDLPKDIGQTAENLFSKVYSPSREETKASSLAEFKLPALIQPSSTAKTEGLATFALPKIGTKAVVSDPDSFANNISRSWYDTEKSLVEGFGIVGDVLGIPSLKEWSVNSAKKSEADIARMGVPERSASIVENYDNIKKAYEEKGIDEAFRVGALALQDMAASAIGSMGIPVVAGLAAVPAGIIGGSTLGAATLIAAPFIAGSAIGAGQIKEEALKLGATEDDANKYALGGGAIVGLLDRFGTSTLIKNLVKSLGKEAVVDGFSKELGEKTAKSVVKKALDFSLDTVVKGGTKSALVEGGTEAAQELVQMGAAGAAADKGLLPYSDVETRNRLLDAAALGAVGGKLIGTVTDLTTAKVYKDLNSRAAELEQVKEKLAKTVDDTEQNLAYGYERETGLRRPTTLQEDRKTLNGVVDSALAYLRPLANSDERGAEIYSAFNTFYDKPYAEIGADVTPVFEALNDLKRTFKLPFQREIPKAINDRLFNVLVTGEQDKDSRINTAAARLRNFFGIPEGDAVTGQPISPVRLTKKDLLESLEKNTPISAVQEALAENKITAEQATAYENSFKPVRDAYSNRIAKAPDEVALIAKDISKSNTFKELVGTLVYTPKLTPNSMLKKAVDNGIDFNFVSEYLPRKIKTGLLNRRKMMKIFEQEGLSKAQAANIADNIEGNNGILVPEELNFNIYADPTTGKPQSTKVGFEESRKLSPNIVKKLEEANLIEKNVESLALNYAIVLNKRIASKKLAETINKNVNSLIADGKIGSPQINHIRDMFDATQHKLKPIQDKRLQGIQKWALTGTYVLTLPLAGLTSITEPIIILTRISPKYALFGAANASYNAFRNSIRKFFPKLKLSQSEKVFREIFQGLDGAMAERFGDISGITSSRVITDAFFKATLLTQVTRLSRDMAFQAARYQMLEDIKTITLSDGEGGKAVKTRAYLDAKKRLLEQGIIDPLAPTIQDWAAGKLKSDPLLIRQALSKTVDEFIMSPNAINRPLWMSNPHLATVAQLKGFMFTFANKIGGRLFREIFVPLFKGRLPTGEIVKYAITFSLLIMATMFVQGLKDSIRYGDEKSPYDELDGKDKIIQALISTNIFGPGTLAYDAANSNKYGSDPLSVVLGPVPARFARVTQALGDYTLNDKPRALAREIANLVPLLSNIPQARPIKKEYTDSIENFLEDLRKIVGD